MSWYHPKSLFDKVFEYGILLKGVDGLLEFLAGLLLLVVKPSTIQHFVSFITQKELLEDPHDFVANFLVHATQNLGGVTTFMIVYLWIHAGVKLVAVFGLLRNKPWAYPFSLITLSVLLLYQFYSLYEKVTIGMLILTVFDAFIIWLIWRESIKVRQQKNNSSDSTLTSNGE